MNLAFQKAWKANRRAQKYGNVKVTTADGTFDSQSEYFENGVRCVEDRKGGKATITDVFRLKQKLVRALYGIEIRIT